MDGTELIDRLRRLCRDLDAGRPLRRIAWVRRSARGAAALLLASGAAGTGACGAGAGEPPPERPAAVAPADAADDYDRGATPEASVEPDADATATGSAGGDPAGGEDGAPPPAPLAAPPSPEEPRRRTTVPVLRAEDTTVVYGAPFAREVVLRVIRREWRRMGTCAEGRGPGRVLVRFTILPDGTVGDSTAETSTFDDQGPGRCLAEVVSTLRFPEPSGGGNVIVRFPFVFGPD